jgi:hypothetical protein
MRVPSMDEIWEVAEAHGANSEAPHLWEGLVGAWPLQEGGGLVAWDVSGRNAKGTLINMPVSTSWLLTERGRATRFQRLSNSYIPTQKLPYTSNGPVSVSAWIKITEASSVMLYFCGDLDANPSNGNPTKNRIALQRRFISGTGEVVRIVSGLSDGATITAPPFNTWHHYVAMVNGTNPISTSLVLDGVLTSTLISSHSNTDFSTFTLGRAGDPNDFYAGADMTNVAVWNRLLSLDECNQLYTDPWAMYRVRPRVLVRGVTLKKTPIHHLMAGCA